MSRFDAVIFDFFGTLTKAVVGGFAVQRVAHELGCDPAAFSMLLNRTYPERAAGGYGNAGASLRHIAHRLGRRPSPAQVKAAAGVKVRAMRVGIQLRPDAVSTLWTLRSKGLGIGLVSDCTEELPAILAELPVATLIDATVFSVLMGLVKPHPSLFLTVCDRLGVKPTRCLYVGDGGGRELSGARAVGMTAVRLAAPDLGSHLVFDVEPQWTGPSVRSLSDVVPLATRAQPADEAPPSGARMRS